MIPGQEKMFEGGEWDRPKPVASTLPYEDVKNLAMHLESVDMPALLESSATAGQLFIAAEYVEFARRVLGRVEGEIRTALYRMVAPNGGVH